MLRAIASGTRTKMVTARLSRLHIASGSLGSSRRHLRVGPYTSRVA